MSDEAVTSALRALQRAGQVEAIPVELLAELLAPIASKLIPALASQLEGGWERWHYSEQRDVVRGLEESREVMRVDVAMSRKHDCPGCSECRLTELSGWIQGVPASFHMPGIADAVGEIERQIFAGMSRRADEMLTIRADPRPGDSGAFERITGD